MKLYNTLNKKIEEIVPVEENKIKMYTCGPTVYNYAHIGNLRTYISEDVLQKALEYLGYEVDRCMNITDVGHLAGDSDDGEDKMEKAAKKENKSALEIAKYYTDAFFEDMKKLNIKKPNIISKATDNIDNYIKMIEKLIKDDYAYLANGNVYFDTSKYDKYYELSNMNKDDIEVGVRDNVEEDKFKKNPADFGLWFTNSKFDNQELKWDSPWGIGYPGWHIECSAISINTLGEYLDIHCGAVDAIFPHHTNEIAQSEAYLGHKWCNNWVHMEFLNDSTGKMSKSKGEFLTLSLLEDKGYNPIAYRYYVLASHYRKILTFTYDNLRQASKAYNKLLSKISYLTKDNNDINKDVLELYINKFKKELENDLNTANCITLIYDVLKEEVNDNTKLEVIKEIDKVLSLNLITNDVKDIKQILYIEDMIEKRNEAKKNKDYALADQIRNELKEKGIILKDTREKTEYYLEV